MRNNYSLHGRLCACAYAHLDTPIDMFAYTSEVISHLLWGTPQRNVFLSVIVPTFQRADYLEEALLSILGQDDVSFSWECIVVDNTPLNDHGSTPALKLIQRLNNSKICYYHNEINIGSGYNWNRGVELARGKWVAFLHDDDILYPDAIKNLGRIIRCFDGSERPLGYIHARRDQFSDSRQLLQLTHSYVPYFEPLTRTRALIRGESGTGVPSCGTAILRRAYLETGGVNYDLGLTADAVLGYQIMDRYQVVVSDTALGAYRWAENETLKRGSLLELVHSDLLFAQYRYGRTSGSRLWGRLFQKCEYSENIRYKIRDGHRKKIELTHSDFDEVCPYRKPNPIVLLVYKLLQKAYSQTQAVKARIRYASLLRSGR